MPSVQEIQRVDRELSLELIESSINPLHPRFSACFPFDFSGPKNVRSFKETIDMNSSKILNNPTA